MASAVEATRNPAMAAQGLSVEQILNRFGPVHQLFLQAMIHDGFMKVEEAAQLIAKISLRSVSSDERNALRQQIENLETAGGRKKLVSQTMRLSNENLRPLGFRLGLIVDENSDDQAAEYLVLASERPYSKGLAGVGQLSADEVALFSKWLDVMMADGADGFLDLTVAINKVSVLPNPMTKDHAQKLIDRLENTKWILVNEGRLRLHPRAVNELSNYLSTQFRPPKCVGCRQMVLNKQRNLPCNHCQSYIHRVCLRTLIQTSGTPSVTCPGRMPNDNRPCQAQLMAQEEAQLNDSEPMETN